MNHTPSRWSIVKIVVLATLVPWLVWQCDRHEPLVGTYRAADGGSDDRQAATLELQANGKGLWSIATDNAPFRWNRQPGGISLHTADGGVIRGFVDGDTIRIEMPGTGDIVFRRER